MSSTSVREPIGPRSIDDMLAEVYGRTTRARRRRQGVTVLVAAVAALTTAATLSLVGIGGGGEAQLRVVDGAKTAGKKATEHTTPTSPPASSADPGANGPSPSSESSNPSGRRHEAALPPPADGPVQTPSVPTTTPDLRLLQEVEDASNDSTPTDWYFDIVRGTVEHERSRGVLVFTTTYRNSGGASTGGRQERTMTSEVQYDNLVVGLTVVERNDELGDPKIDAAACAGCTASFDPVRARLVVVVPVSTFDAAVAQRSPSSSPFRSNSTVDDLVVHTLLGSGSATLPADSTNDAEVGQ